MCFDLSYNLCDNSDFEFKLNTLKKNGMDNVCTQKMRMNLKEGIYIWKYKIKSRMVTHTVVGVCSSMHPQKSYCCDGTQAQGKNK